MFLMKILNFLFQTHFVRHDTPHPRELKARHQKFLKDRNIDGHVIPHIDNKDGVSTYGTPWKRL